MNKMKVNNDVKHIKEVMDTDLMVDVEELENSPFAIVKFNKQYFLALGKYRLSDLQDSREDCERLLELWSWDTMIAIIYAVAQEVVLINAEEQKNNGKAKK